MISRRNAATNLIKHKKKFSAEKCGKARRKMQEIIVSLECSYFIENRQHIYQAKYMKYY